MSNAIIWWGGVRPPLAPLTALGEGGMPGHIGIEFVDCGDDWIRARMPVDERTQQPFKRLHGGASVVLAETVGSVAAAYHGRGKLPVGIELSVSHHRSAISGHVSAAAEPVHLGGTLASFLIPVLDDEGRRIATGRLTCLLPPWSGTMRTSRPTRQFLPPI